MCRSRDVHSSLPDEEGYDELTTDSIFVIKHKQTSELGSTPSTIKVVKPVMFPLDAASKSTFSAILSLVPFLFKKNLTTSG